MKYLVIGMERKEGVYQGYAYDNTYYHCTYEKEGVEGLACTSIKVKTANVNEAVTVGDTVAVYYDRYGKPTAVYKD